MLCQVDGCTVGVAGAKGFGGGFPGRSGSSFGEPEMKAFMRHREATMAGLRSALESLGEADLRLARMHYSPVEETLLGERCEIYPFLGSYYLAEPSTAVTPPWPSTGMPTAAHRRSDVGGHPGPQCRAAGNQALLRCVLPGAASTGRR